MSDRFECTECHRAFDSEKGMKIHRGKKHKPDYPSFDGVLNNTRSSRDQVPPIISYEVEAGIETVEEYLERAEQADTRDEERQFRRLARMELRTVKRRIQ